jgi:hypothetical protein
LRLGLGYRWDHERSFCWTSDTAGKPSAGFEGAGTWRWLMPERLSNVPLTSLVPETRTWQIGEPVSLEKWINAVGSSEHLIAYGELLWPDFVEHDGCILCRGFT